MKNQVRVTHRDPGFTAVRDDEAEQDDHAYAAVIYRPRPLGDWVETWAKPIGCWLDRMTAKLPWQFVKIRHVNGVIYTIKLRPWWQDLLLALRLPATCRTQFCGCSACSKRRRFLNQVVPDTTKSIGWLGLFSRIGPAFRSVYRTDG